MTDATAVTGAEILVDALEALGVEYVFGVPGGAALPILDVLARRGPRYILCRDETGAVFMAQAMGRITGMPGVVLTTSGPGLINAVCGTATATEDRDPVVIITGHVPRRMQFRQSHMNLDSVALYAPITKWSVEAQDPATLPEILANAFRIAMLPRSGAVHVSIPVDVATATLPGLLPTPWVPPPLLGPASPPQLQDAAAVLSRATAPALLLGVRAGQAAIAPAVRRFLDRHPWPTAMTFESAGTLSRTHLPCFIGRVGYVRNQPADEVLQKADVVLAVGYDSIEYDPAAWRGDGSVHLVHLDEIPAGVERSYRPDVELTGAIGESLDALADFIGPTPLASRPEVKAARDWLAAEEALGAEVSGSPVHPLRFIHDLRQTLADDITVTCDVGAHEIWMARHFFCFEPRHLLFSMGHQTMGVALPWAIGAALARPGRKVVSVSGDGSFMMTCMELETAVRLKLPIVHCIWRDDGYNLIHCLQERDFGRSFGCSFGPIDYVGLARSMGAMGLRIEQADAIVPTLKQALAAEGPVVIEVPIDYRDNGELVHSVEAAALH